MSNKFYTHFLKGQSYFFTIDPGCRSDGGTGLAFWHDNKELPQITEQFGSLKNLAGLHDLKMEHSLKKINNFLMEYEPDIPVFIEEPKFFESFKGMTAAKSGSLFKLIFFYGRLFELVSSLGLKPIPLQIHHWKGQMNKQRVRAKLDRLYPDNDWKGDVEDAVGMGLFLKGIF